MEKIIDNKKDILKQTGQPVSEHNEEHVENEVSQINITMRVTHIYANGILQGIEIKEKTQNQWLNKH
ncbi:MAG: hypothetical protein COV35_08345 [Alphaproteobacteria bacterium CG11_big_fil_rev_8_21_14_0_20_39_49]|nr:MAG: hypothetical protein COV35_08345 [Alphaproteobacteria bacterium CG11_big_fil_rev_8_21_14_0_20_39_49]